MVPLLKLFELAGRHFSQLVHASLVRTLKQLFHRVCALFVVLEHAGSVHLFRQIEHRVIYELRDFSDLARIV